MTDGFAPAKVNLTLHVTGQRSDGYHLLDSLVVFANIGDRLTVEPAKELHLSVNGPKTAGVPTDGRNIVLKAAETLRRARAVKEGAHLFLEKHLPNAAGLGGGSSNAATALRILAKLWYVEQLTDQEALSIGADVPVCLRAPTPARMSGIGEIIQPLSPMPKAAMVLVNPGVDVPTGATFNGLDSKSNPAMSSVPSGISFDEWCTWLKSQRNDLLEPAQTQAPGIAQLLKQLDAFAQVGFAGMSGSGATCYALIPDKAAAENIADSLKSEHPDHWIAAAELLT